jgi:hypothetical protein
MIPSIPNKKLPGSSCSSLNDKQLTAEELSRIIARGIQINTNTGS